MDRPRKRAGNVPEYDVSVSKIVRDRSLPAQSATTNHNGRLTCLAASSSSTQGSNMRSSCWKLCLLVLLSLWLATHSVPMALGRRQENKLNTPTMILQIPRGGWTVFPAGWNPFGYKMTKLGEEFLTFEGCRDCDVGRFLASLKGRKSWKTIKDQWLEIVRVSKQGQSLRVYRGLETLLNFCLRAGFVN